MNITADELFSDQGQLKHKLRTETDLIRHIQTREEDTASYCLFLGAGASVTSGIRTAGALIDEWLIELYERFEEKKITDVEIVRDYFTNKHPSWYNPSNPYSSLFEKKYDFASQRRRFIEREVDQKLPSIGYSYLISLVDSNYFNTIFTTNFDDLINEAFYQFSNKRPIYCAHDSSIHSVSVTSKRPKIIKLHGDYLFDDIKSTLRETETLEHNTKDKLKEFCKEFGFIFIGYAGNDRSIMDVLEYLLKQENYLKNGIYWCFRRTDKVNHTLRNLLWKENIYPVLIDGFDEFLAKAHSSLMKRGLDIGATEKKSKLQITIKKILADEYNLSANEIIKSDIKEIVDSNSRHDISNFINDLSKDDNREVPLPDFRNLLEIEDILNNKEFNKAYDLCELYFQNSESDIVRSKYLSKLIQISRDMGNKQRAIAWSDQLIQLDPNNISYAFQKAECISDLSKKFSYINGLSQQHPFSYEVRNKVVSVGFRWFKNSPEFCRAGLDDLIDELDKSLKLNPSLNNYAWKLKATILEYLKKITKENSKKIDNQIDKHIKKAVECNPQHLNTLRLQVDRVLKSEDMVTAKRLVEELYNKMDISSKRIKHKVLNILNDLFREIHSFPANDGYKTIVKEFYESKLNDEEIKDDVELLLSKANYYLGQKRSLSDAKRYYDIALSCKDIANHVNQASDLFYVFDNENLDDVEKQLINNESNFESRYFYLSKSEIETRKVNHHDALISIEKAYKSGISLTTYLLHKSYILLKLEKYEQIFELFDSFKQSIDDLKLDEFVINYQLAAKLNKSSRFDKTVLRNLYGHSSNMLVKICAYSILDQEKDARRLIRKKIDSNYLYYYRFKRWPAVGPKLLEGIDKEKAA